MELLPNPFNLPLAGIVNAAGALTVSFGPKFNEFWNVEQVSIEMPAAPQGATVDIRYMGSLVAPSPSARRAAASGDPPIYLNGGETMTVNWTASTAGIPGKVLVVYRKGIY